MIDATMHCRLLLPVRVLRGGRTDRDERAVPELHVPQPDAHVLPQVVRLTFTQTQCTVPI